MTTDDDTLAVLLEIRDNQAAALAMQREQFELYKRQYDRAERINERAEAIQERHAGTVDAARRALWIALPLLALVVAYLLWPVLVAIWR